MINYAEKIKEYRERQFLAQKNLAKILGVTSITVNRWENGGLLWLKR
jgi:DNA-binding XRE family transcriptional regulator